MWVQLQRVQEGGGQHRPTQAFGCGATAAYAGGGGGEGEAVRREEAGIKAGVGHGSGRQAACPPCLTNEVVG